METEKIEGSRLKRDLGNKTSIFGSEFWLVYKGKEDVLYESQISNLNNLTDGGAIHKDREHYSEIKFEE